MADVWPREPSCSGRTHEGRSTAHYVNCRLGLARVPNPSDPAMSPLPVRGFIKAALQGPARPESEFVFKSQCGTGPVVGEVSIRQMPWDPLSAIGDAQQHFDNGYVSCPACGCQLPGSFAATVFRHRAGPIRFRTILTPNRGIGCGQ